MRIPRTLVLGTLLATLSAQPERGLAREDSIEKCIYELVDSRLRPHAKDRLLKFGAAAALPLTNAALAGEARWGGRAWSDANRDPRQAHLSGTAIRLEASLAALHVLQELGADAAAGFEPLFDALRPWTDFRKERRLQDVIAETVLRLGILIDDTDRLREHRIFKGDPRLRFDPPPTLESLLAEIERILDRDDWGGTRISACCYRLELRWRDVAQSAELRKRAIRLLAKALPRYPADPDTWPLSVAQNRKGTTDYWNTLAHDRGSLLLARIAPNHPLAIRGNMILVVDIRAQTRHEAAIQLGQVGARAAQATHALLARIADSDARVRQIAVTSLGLIGPAARAAIPHLRTLTFGKNRRLAATARAALRHVDPEPAEVWTYYHFNGNVQAAGRCDAAGRKTGPWTHWDTSGNREWQGHYVKGRLHGRWKHWNVSGEHIYEYEHGRLVSSQPPAHERRR